MTPEDNLLQLPGVVWQAIVSNLQVKDLTALRLVCRASRDIVDRGIYDLKVELTFSKLNGWPPVRLLSNLTALKCLELSTIQAEDTGLDSKNTVATFSCILASFNAPHLQSLTLYLCRDLVSNGWVPLLAFKFPQLQRITLSTNLLCCLDASAEADVNSCAEATYGNQLLLSSLPTTLTALEVSDTYSHDCIPVDCLSALSRHTALTSLNVQPVSLGLPFFWPPGAAGAACLAEAAVLEMRNNSEAAAVAQAKLEVALDAALQPPGVVAATNAQAGLPLQGLLHLPKLQDFSLCTVLGKESAVVVEDTVLAMTVASLTTLTSLRFCSGDVVERSAPGCLTVLSRLAALKYLEMDVKELELTEAEWASLAGLKKLEHVVLPEKLNLPAVAPYPTLHYPTSSTSAGFPAAHSLMVPRPFSSSFQVLGRVLQDMAGLRHLNLELDKKPQWEAALLELSALTRLSHLRLSAFYGGSLSEPVHDAVASWSRSLQQLHVLHLCNFEQLNDDDLLAIAEGFPSLRELHLESCPNITAVPLTLLAGKPCMQKLVFKYCGVRPGGGLDARSRTHALQVLQRHGLPHVKLDLW